MYYEDITQVCKRQHLKATNNNTIHPIVIPLILERELNPKIHHIPYRIDHANQTDDFEILPLTDNLEDFDNVWTLIANGNRLFAVEEHLDLFERGLGGVVFAQALEHVQALLLLAVGH